MKIVDASQRTVVVGCIAIVIDMVAGVRFDGVIDNNAARGRKERTIGTNK